MDNAFCQSGVSTTQYLLVSMVMLDVLFVIIEG